MIEAPFDHAESAKAENVSTRALLRRLWQHCRLRKRAVALILAACALETGFYWIVPLAFRSLIDNTLGRRDEHALVQLTAVLIGGAAVACIGSIQRGRVYAHLQSQIISDLRFQLFHKIHQLPVSFFTTTPSAQVVAVDVRPEAGATPR